MGSLWGRGFCSVVFCAERKKYKKTGIDTLLETDIAGWKSTFSNRRYTYKWSKCSLLCWFTGESEQRFGSLKMNSSNLKTKNPPNPCKKQSFEPSTSIVRGSKAMNFPDFFFGGSRKKAIVWKKQHVSKTPRFFVASSLVLSCFGA